MPEKRAPSRVPINIDPSVRHALSVHLMTKYSGTGIGFSEFIRRAIAKDGGHVPTRVQPDNRWRDLSVTCHNEEHNSVVFEEARGYRLRKMDCIDCAREEREK